MAEHELDEILQLIPELDLPLDHCDRRQAHGLIVPVIVTLERRKDRWEKTVGELSRIGITHVIKASGVDGAALSDKDLTLLVHEDCNIAGPPRSHLHLTRPAIGCFISHLKIWKCFLRSRADRLLILEDDVVPAADYSASFAHSVLSSIPSNADLVLLGGAVMGGLSERTNNEFLSRVYYFNGTYAYVITRKGCENLLKHLIPMNEHIDHQTSGALVGNRHSLFAYYAQPNLFQHDFTVLSDAYVPIEGSDEADRELGEIIRRAREQVFNDGSSASQDLATACAA